MIGTRTPFRMSFFGGGSDLKEYYMHSDGCVLSTTIDKYMYIFLHPYFDDRIQVKYSKTELVEKASQIQHPIVREALKLLDLKGIDINSIADIPAGTGLGSSSSFTVGLLHALYKYSGQSLSAELLAQKACELEIEILNEPIGKQDQYAAAKGGLNMIRFLPSGAVEIEQVKMDSGYLEQLQKNLLLFYVGSIRSASDVLRDQRQNILNEKSKRDVLKQMVEMTEDARIALQGSDIDTFGKLLDQSWSLKKSLSNKITSHDLDDIYATAKNHGVLGGKLLGAGGGGFFLFYCPSSRQKSLRGSLRQLREISFSFESKGSVVIINDSQD